MPTKKVPGSTGAKVIALSHDGGPVGPRRPPSQRGRKQTPAQKAAFARARASVERRAVAAAEREDPDAPTRWQRLLDGELTPRDMDDEELSRMQCRTWNGDFVGRPPNVPNKISRAIKDEILRRGEKGFNKYGPRAIRVVAEIMMDKTERGSDRLRAAAMILERVYGKVPEELRTTVESAWDETFDEVSTEFADDAETA